MGAGLDLGIIEGTGFGDGMSGYQWQAWQVVFQNPAVAISGINYTGNIATSSAIAVEVRISVVSETSGNLDVQLLGSDIQSLSESVAGLSGRRFFSKTGSISFTVPSASVSEFNIKCHNLFDEPIGLKIETRIAEDSSQGGGGTVDLTGVEANTDNVETLLQQLQTTLASIVPLIDGLELVTGAIKLDATTVNLAVDGVEGALANIEQLLAPGAVSASTDVLLTDTVALLQQIRNSAQNLDLLIYQSNVQTDGLEGLLTGIEGQGVDANIALNLVNGKLTDIRGLIDGVEGSLATISTSSSALETQLFNIDSAIGDCNSLLAAEGADVALIRPAVQALRATLEQMQVDDVANWSQLQTALNNLQVSITTIYGAVSTIDSNLSAIALQSTPLIYQSTEIWDPQNGDYITSADSARRAVKIENNTGEANGRGAATLFLAYNGENLDRVNHTEWFKSGESAFLQCPTLEFRILAEGVAGVNGYYSVVRYT